MIPRLQWPLGSAKTKALFGALGVSFQGTAEVEEGGFADFSGYVEASWSDKVTLKSPRFSSPHPLIINGPLLLDGDMEIIPGPNGGGRVDLLLADVSLQQDSLPDAPISADPSKGIDAGTWGLAINDTTYLPPPTQIDTSRTCATGVPCDVGYNMLIKVSGLTSEGGFEETRADFGSTLSWGGITSVRDALTGEPIDDWTITSESGFDYSKPFGVPEPTAGIMLLIGMVTMFTYGRPLAARLVRR